MIKRGKMPPALPPLQGFSRIVAVFGEPLLRRKSRVQFPDNKRRDEVQQWLRRLHVGNGHMPPSEMQQVVRDAGGSQALCKAAREYSCPLCNIDKPLQARRKSSLPLRARFFNNVVLTDLAFVTLEREGSPPLKCVVIAFNDLFSTYARAFILDRQTSAAAFDAAQRGWISPYGAPHRVYHDSALNFKSEHWALKWGRYGTVVTTSAAELLATRLYRGPVEDDTTCMAGFLEILGRVAGRSSARVP